jgi:glutamate-1-semialdehyde 2,1-aminomutase
LRKLQRVSPYAELEARTRAMGLTLQTESVRHSALRVRCQTAGSIFWICLDDAGEKSLDESSNIRSPAQIPAAHARLYPPLFHALLDNGIYLAPSPWEVGFLSTAHDAYCIDTFLAAANQALAALAEH